MKPDFRPYFLSALVAFSVAAFSIGALAATLSSPALNFNITHNQIAINHTNSFNASFNLTANSSMAAQIFSVSGSTSIGPSYLQPNATSVCGEDLLGFKPSVYNGTHSSSSIFLTGGQSANVSIYLNDTLVCRPGRWFGGLTIANNSLSSEGVTINVTIDIPITSSTGAFNKSIDGLSFFNGTMSANSQSYHSYFINASAFPGTTSVLVNLTASGDLDMFLLDSSGTLMAKSISAGTSAESIVKGPLSNQMYELRIYGNSTSSIPYNGSVIFSAMNLANSTSPNSGLLFVGARQPSSTVTTNVILSNNGSALTMPNLVESSEIALVKRFYGNLSTNYFFLVPDFVDSVRVSVNWTVSSSAGVMNYSMSVTAPNGTVIGNSTNRFVNANVSGVDQEEFVEVRNFTSGIWKVSVFTNNVPAGNNNSYLVTARMLLNPSQWIVTNFSSLVNTTFTNSSGVNTSRTLQVNLTVPNSSLDGSYEGFLGYTTSAGATYRAPLLFSVQSGSIIVNQSLNSSTYTIQDNVGQNGTRTFVVGINNTGSSNIVYNTTNSTALFLDSTHYVNFSYLNISGVLSQNESKTVIFNYTLDTSTFNNTEGVYTGWVFFNATEARPSAGHNLTIRLNLTRDLKFRFVDILSAGTADNTINTTTIPEDILVRFFLSFANGTNVTDNDGYAFGSSITNFTFYMRHANVSSWTVPVNRSVLNGSMVKKPGFSSNALVYADTFDRFDVWATMPENTLGGFYDFIGVAVYNNTTTYVGSAQFASRIDVRNAALFMSTNFTGCSFGGTCAPSTYDLTENRTVRTYVLINNFGTAAASSFAVNMTESCSAVNVTTVQENCTGGSSSGGAWTSLTPAAGESCILSWDIGAQAGGANCGVNVEGTTSPWFHPSGVNLTINPELASSSSSSSSSSESSSSSSSSSTAAATTTAATATSEATYLQITKWTSIVEIVQGSSKDTSVIVKNVDEDANQVVSLLAKSLPSGASASVDPESLALSAGESGEFTVSLTVPDSVAVDDYTSQLEASSTKATITKDFTLRVLPGAAAKVKIAADLTNYTSEFDLFWKEVNASKSSGTNVSSTEAVVEQIRAKIAEAQAQVALGTDAGYFAASQLLEEVANLLSTAKSQLKVDKQSAGFVFPIDPLYIGIGVGVVAIGFLVYLFLPTKGIRMNKPLQKAGDAAGAVKDAAGSAAGKVTDAAGSVKDTTVDQFKKLQEKFRLKKEFKYKYEE